MIISHMVHVVNASYTQYKISCLSNSWPSCLFKLCGVSTKRYTLGYVRSLIGLLIAVQCDEL